MLTLSICIPSYNRFEKLNETIEKILKSGSKDFDVIIVDNCSPRRIEEFIDCSDERVKIIHRESAVRGEQSVNECVGFADASYALLLLDKDVIEGEYIADLITILKDSKVSGGYCEINSTNHICEFDREDAVVKFGYLSKHPSGNIYKTDFVKEYISQEPEIIGTDAFGFDYALAYVASRGTMLLYNKPLVFSQLDKPVGKPEKSLSFNPQNNNVFYLPMDRTCEFKKYAGALDKLLISKEMKLKVFEKLYQRTISQVTIQYRKVMKNEFTCYHYGHDTKRVSIFEMVDNYHKVNSCINEMELSYLSLDDKKKIKCNVLKKGLTKILKKLIKR